MTTNNKERLPAASCSGLGRRYRSSNPESSFLGLEVDWVFKRWAIQFRILRNKLLIRRNQLLIMFLEFRHFLREAHIVCREFRGALSDAFYFFLERWHLRLGRHIGKDVVDVFNSSHGVGDGGVDAVDCPNASDQATASGRRG